MGNLRMRGMMSEEPPSLQSPTRTSTGRLEKESQSSGGRLEKKRKSQSSGGGLEKKSQSSGGRPRLVEWTWTKLWSLALLLLLGILAFFIVVYAVNARARLPSIGFFGARIRTLEPGCGFADYDKLVINVTLELNASSDYSVKFSFQPGRMFVAYLINASAAYNISDGATPSMSVGGSRRSHFFYVECNSSLAVPKQVIDDFKNERAALVTRRIFVHGELRARYRTSPILATFYRSVRFCRNLTINFQEGSESNGCGHVYTPSLWSHQPCSV